MRWLRFPAAAVIVALALLAIHRWCWEPLRCDVAEKSILAATAREYDVRDSFSGVRANENLTVLRRCLEHVHGRVSLYMLTASNLRLVAAPEEAIAMYETALRYDRRPEIYAEIGDCQIDLGRTDDAVRSFVTAGMFSPEYILGIRKYDVRMRVDEIVSRQRMLPWHVTGRPEDAVRNRR